MATDLAEWETAFAIAWPASEWRDLHVALAVSGGADSVALLRLMHSAKARAGGSGRLFVVHLNHGIREAADEDAAWLDRLCNELGIPCEIGTADVAGLAARQGDGLEAAARTARYEFMQHAAERLGARFVATAHIADDQVETVLHRILRGTGVAGLAGIPRSRPLGTAVQLIRPMLGLWRTDIESYLAQIGQDYRVDATNTDPRHTRNRLRHELLPLIRAKFNPDVDAALTRLADQAGDAQRVLNDLADQLVRRAMKVSPAGLELDCSQLAAENPLLVREACKLAWTSAEWPLQDMGYDEWQLLETLIAAPPANDALSLPGRIRAVRSGNLLQISQATQVR